MKVLVAVKRVRDPDSIRDAEVTPAGDGLFGAASEWKTNPFDEYAVETALRLTEDGRAPKERRGEVVVVTFGPSEAASVLRAAMAMGADRSLRVDTDDESLDGRLVALGLGALVGELAPDLVILGKQCVDGDGNNVGQMLAELLDWPMATCAVALREEEGALRVEREVDGGTLSLRVRLPAVLTVDLRIVAPRGVYSRHTAVDHRYAEGIRFAPLPSIVAAKRKPLTVREIAELVPSHGLATHHFRFGLPTGRPAGRIVASVSELVELLASDAKVI